MINVAKSDVFFADDRHCLDGSETPDLPVKVLQLTSGIFNAVGLDQRIFQCLLDF